MCASRSLFVMTCFLVLIGLAPMVHAQVCHDGVWEPNEFCGRDAYLVTGEAEMNHDCFVNLHDLYLFMQQFPPAVPGPNASADLNGDGFVDPVDLQIFAGSYTNTVVPCVPFVSQPSQGTIAVSFSSNPATIVDSTGQSPGGNTAYIVVDGWTDAAMAEYAIETSSNITITSHMVDFAFGNWLTCDPNPQNSLRATAAHFGNYGTGPLVFATVTYVLTDANPAWIRFRPLFECYQNTGPVWGKPTEEILYKFVNVLGAGINGGMPIASGVGSEMAPAVLSTISLSPNPFNPSTTIHFRLESPMVVTATVWSVDGTAVRTLSDQQLFSPGDNQLVWDGRDNLQSLVASGVYFIRLETPFGNRITSGVLLK